jgi:hypothetical protein
LLLLASSCHNVAHISLMSPARVRTTGMCFKWWYLKRVCWRELHLLTISRKKLVGTLVATADKNQ